VEEDGFELPVPPRRGTAFLHPLQLAKPVETEVFGPNRDQWFESVFPREESIANLTFGAVTSTLPAYVVANEAFFMVSFSECP
jgi:hypothetical protein